MPYRKQEEHEFTTLNSINGYRGRNFELKFPSSSSYGFPDIKPFTDVDNLPKHLVPYNELSNLDASLSSSTATHFYIDDSKFESCWTYPARAMTRLLKTAYVIGPDFSMIEGWPLIAQQYNKFRSHWCMALWQAEGFNVIPNVSWVGDEIWCFNGIPKKSVLSVSTVGLAQTKEARERFEDGFDFMVRCLQPLRVLVYGSAISAKWLNEYERLISLYPYKWDRKPRNNKCN